MILEVARPYDRRVALKDLFVDFNFDTAWAEKYRNNFEL